MHTPPHQMSLERRASLSEPGRENDLAMHNMIGVVMETEGQKDERGKPKLDAHMIGIVG